MSLVLLTLFTTKKPNSASSLSVDHGNELLPLENVSNVQISSYFLRTGVSAYSHSASATKWQALMVLVRIAILILLATI